MARTFLIIISALIFVECHRKDKPTNITCNEDQIKSSLVMNLAMTYPHYKVSYKLDPLLKEQILKVRRKVLDEKMGIYMELHSWDGDFKYPKNIIYITNLKEFRYAFPFYDEELYREIHHYFKVDREKDKLYKYLNAQTSLTQSLNYVSNSLKISNDSLKLKQFLTLFADSLLGLEKVSIEDTLELKSYKNQYHLNRNCTSDLKANIPYIIENLKNNQALYYKNFDGLYGIWEFKINSSYIRAEFLNKECYTILKF